MLYLDSDINDYSSITYETILRIALGIDSFNNSYFKYEVAKCISSVLENISIDKTSIDDRLSVLDKFAYEIISRISLEFPVHAKLAKENYLIFKDGVRNDASRYKNKNSFWPNPLHPKYSRSISDVKLSVKSIPLVEISTPIGSAGSCFATEIGDILQLEGFNYRSYEPEDKDIRGLIINQSLSKRRVEKNLPSLVDFSADYGIIFNSLSLAQLAQRCIEIPNDDDKIIVKTTAGYRDPFRQNIIFTSIDAYHEEYDIHTNAVINAFSNIKVFIFTLGLNECWRSKITGKAISRNPRSEVEYSIFCHDTLTIEDNINAIQKFMDIIRSFNSNFELILSVSPIPFMATGNCCEMSVIEANHYSKSMLTVAAQILAEKNSNIHYLPTFENTIYCLQNPWEEDLRHVNKHAIMSNIELFKEIFFRNDGITPAGS